MIKYTVERVVQFDELYGIKEKEGRVFKVNYFDSIDHIWSEKIFKYKDNLFKFLDNSRWSRIKLYVGDVVYE